MPQKQKIPGGIPKLPEIRQVNVDEIDLLTNQLLKNLKSDGIGLAIEDARQAVEHGWDIRKIRFMKRVVDNWNRALRTNVKCVFESDSKDAIIKSGTPVVESDGYAGIVDGKLNFNQALADEVLQSPNFIIGHECGHELERKCNFQAGGSTQGLKHGEGLNTPGFCDLCERHDFPPFGAAIHHEEILKEVFKGSYPVFDKEPGEKSVGYNARQIYCDSVPVKEVMLCKLEGKTPPVSMRQLMSEAIGFLDRRYQLLSTQMAPGGISYVRVDLIPHLVRYSATAWALRSVAGAWINDWAESEKKQKQLESFSQRFDSLLLNPSARPNHHAQRFIETRDGMHGIESVEGDSPFFSKEQVYVIGILVRAYHDHFLNCLSMKEFLKDVDLTAHIEKLKSSDEITRRQEAYTLGQMGTSEVIRPLLDVVQNPKESKSVKLIALKSISLICSKAVHSQKVRGYTRELVDLLSDKDPDIVEHAISVLSHAGGAHEVLPLMKLAVEADNRLKKKAYSAIHSIVNCRSYEIPDFLDYCPTPEWENTPSDAMDPRALVKIYSRDISKAPKTVKLALAWLSKAIFNADPSVGVSFMDSLTESHDPDILFCSGYGIRKHAKDPELFATLYERGLSHPSQQYVYGIARSISALASLDEAKYKSYLGSGLDSQNPIVRAGTAESIHAWLDTGEHEKYSAYFEYGFKDSSVDVQIGTLRSVLHHPKRDSREKIISESQKSLLSEVQKEISHLRWISTHLPDN
jgi:hypothetical protein